MATTSKIAASEGSGKNIGTYSINEDTLIKEIQRVVLNDSNGAEKVGQQTSANSIPAVLSIAQEVILNTIATNTGAQSLDTLFSGGINALNGTVAINTQGAYTVSALILGTWVGTLIAEGLMADGATWVQLPMYVVQTSLPYPQILSATTNSSVLITGGGYTSIRLRASLWTSGTVNISLNASLAQQTVFNAQLGTWKVLSDSKQTYGAGIVGLVMANTPTDVFTITGSATKTIRIKHISCDGIQTATGAVNVSLIKRSTANTAGTSTTLTDVPFDSTNSAATATIRAYTANPTLGTSVGIIHSEKVYVGTTAVIGDELKLDFTNLSNMQEIVLRGINEVLSLNFNGVTVTGNNMNMDITWTEE